jgi:hypothetical protein
VCNLAAEVHQLDRHTQPIALDRDFLLKGLQEMAPRLRAIANNGVAMGLEPSVHAHLRLGIEARANELEKLG